MSTEDLKEGFAVPILLIIFRRPDTTKIVFEAIRKVRPQQLFIAADGPRPDRPDDVTLRDETIRIVSQVDWPCEVKTWYKTENVGCGRNISSALDWFFTEVEEGIILEDDTVPSDSFFPYCAEMLGQYRNDSRIMHIGGVNFQDGIKRGECDYYFSRYAFVWGWASWRRAWKEFDFDLNAFPEFLREKRIRKIFKNRVVQQYWEKIFDNYYRNPEKRTAWSYQWNFAIFNQTGITIIPNKNLISNIGYGPDATHTTHDDFMAGNPVFELEFPLQHPSEIKPDAEADHYFNQKVIKDVNRTIRDDFSDWLKQLRGFRLRNQPLLVRMYQKIRPLLVKLGIRK
jgi:hypothetical protein